MADYVKPVVVHNQFLEDDDAETQVDVAEGYSMVCSFVVAEFLNVIFHDCA